LGLIAHEQGEYALARDHYLQALAVGRAINNERSTGYILTHLGYTLVELDDLAGAAATLEQALVLRRSLGNEAGAVDALGGLALAADVGNTPERALEYVARILTWIKENGTDGLEFPVQLYLICYRVLRAVAEKASQYQTTAWSALTTGYALLQERAGRIQDEQLRRQYLENVPFNRDIQAAYARTVCSDDFSRQRTG
jgi:hypothetical protein